jgi:hypothetical protein
MYVDNLVILEDDEVNNSDFDVKATFALVLVDIGCHQIEPSKPASLTN